jgi:chromosome segregation ATPase
MTVSQRWFRRLFGWSGAFRTYEELARLSAALRDKHAALEQAGTRLDQLTRDAVKDREARERAEKTANEMQSAMNRLVAELAHERGALMQQAPTPGLSPDSTRAVRRDSSPPDRGSYGLQQRAEVAERDAETLRELNGRLLEELEELKSELEHLRAESIRAGTPASIRTTSLPPASLGSGRPPT